MITKDTNQDRDQLRDHERWPMSKVVETVILSGMAVSFVIAAVLGMLYALFAWLF